MKINALFLDLDGTLHDFEPAAMEAMEAIYGTVLEKYPSISRSGLKREYACIWKIAREQVFSDGKRSWGARAERFGALLSRFGIEDKELLERLVNEYGAEYAKKVRPFDCVVEQLEKLSSTLDIYIVTDGADGQRIVVESLGISKFIKGVYTASDSKSSKQSGGLFRYALEKSRLSPEEVIAVGDWYERDILGAQVAGIRSIWLNRGQRLPGCPCPSLIAIIEDIKELPDVLEKLS